MTPAYQPRHERAPEPSTFIRYFTVLASKVDGDFDLDFIRTNIALFPLWIAEGKDQQQIHERYVNATMFILAAVHSESVQNELDEDAREELASLENEINACNIVEVYTSSTEDVTAKGDIDILWGTSMKDKDASSVVVKDSSKRVFCRKEFYEQGLHTATENGYRRINCGARALFYRALKLAASCGMLDAEKNTISIRGRGINAEETDDYLSKTKRQLGGGR